MRPESGASVHLVLIDTVPGSGDEAVPVTVIPFNQFVQDSEGNDGWKPPGVEF